MNAEPSTIDSFIVLDDGSLHSLRIPSGAQTGLKLVSGFVVPVNGSADFTIDFDLRKSVHNPQGLMPDYILRPALRMIDNAMVGAIAGTVDAALINAAGCTEGDAVYVFEGFGVIPDDVDGADPEPVSSASVTMDIGSGEFTYRAAFLLEGDYTIAFTCQADDDDPATADSIAFGGAADVSVTAGQTTSHDF